MLVNKNKIPEELVAEQIAVAVCFAGANPDNAVIVYKAGGAKNEFRYIITGLPKNGTFRYETVLEIIRNTERVDSVYYKDGAGRAKPVYVLRSTEGKVFDIVERDFVRGRFTGNFSEIAMTGLRIGLESTDAKQPKNTVLSCKIKPTKNDCAENSLGYALLNACNACMLGKVFDSREFDVVTYDGDKAKLEVRLSNAVSNDEDLICVSPVLDNNGCCTGVYATERFECIDGKSRIKYAYAIIYDALNSCYRAERN